MHTKAIVGLRRLLAGLALLLLAACATPGGESRPAVKAPDSALHSEIAMQALAQLGIPYANGGDSPAEGFDCSGLIGYAYKQATGVTLPRTTYALAKFGLKVDDNALEPGDLVFFDTQGRADSHVGIYLGEQRFVHAPATGGVVRVEDMRIDYWRKRYSGARRIDPAGLRRP
jgi:cell wall-associated NlpC family hydrolase